MGNKFLDLSLIETYSSFNIVLTRNEGERKFSINQNLTVLSVFRRTLSIMIEDRRYTQSSLNKQKCQLRALTSYKWPEATVKTLMSACLRVLGVLVPSAIVSSSGFFSLDPQNIDDTLCLHSESMFRAGSESYLL